MELQHDQQPRTALINELLQSGLPSRTLLCSVGKIYHGTREGDGRCNMWVERTTGAHSTSDGKPASSPLPLHLDLRNHSPTGFAWGYSGSGPAQLALALLMDATGEPTLALRHYQEFKFKFVADWRESWSITETEVLSFIAAQENPAGCHPA